jgi:multicomponent Na+:H+ antiporter subunit A
MLLLMLLIVIGGAIAAPWVSRLGGGKGVYALTLIPVAALGVLLATIAPGGTPAEVYPWVPGLGMAAAFRLDGLSLLMAGLVLGIGVFIVAYAAEYLQGDARQPRFMATLLAFMAAMLGLVIADDVLLLFVFWELTSVTSFMLIGFDHTQEKARKAAFQGLFITVAGGLCLLAGLLVLGEAAGSYRVSDWLGQGAELVAHPESTLALALVVLGCITKSAQFPFHFWLPNAMAAPTPVSAYLHSATMVKAGVFLLAKLYPVLGTHPGWSWLIPLGAGTALFAALMAFRADEFKRILAFTTVMALGTLTMLIGLGEVQAAVAFLLAHALYKGALFLLAGIVTHESDAKKVSQVSGLRRHLPWTFAAALLAAASGAGLMPWFGFIAKELLLEASLAHAPWLAGMVLLTAGLVGGMLFTFALRPFMGTPRAPHALDTIHDAGPWLLAGPVVLAVLGVVLGLAPGLIDQAVLLGAASASGAVDPVPLALWHGVNLAFLASLASLAIAGGVWWLWPRLQQWAGSPHWDRFGPEAAYHGLVATMEVLARAFIARFQSGLLRRYVALTLISTLVLLTLTLFRGPAVAWPVPQWAISPPIVVAIGIIIMAVFATRVIDALGAALILGSVGFGIALLYLWFSAPDLAITQVLIETLTTILLVLILFRLPPMRRLSPIPQRRADVVLALAVGGVLSLVLWQVLVGAESEPISTWLAAESVPGGHGRNIVNVILVDFRALDTLGEIFVLALAAVGVYALLRRSLTKQGRHS